MMEERSIDRALALLKRGNRRQALAILSKLSDAGLSNLYQGFCYLEAGDLQRAEAYLRASLSSAPDLASAHLLLGFVLMEKFEHDPSVEDEIHAHFSTYLQLCPEEEEIQAFYRSWCALS